MPSAANGISATRTRPVIRSQFPNGWIRTPSAMPDAYSNTIEAAAIR
jgi:hypothetical protein